MALLQISEPGKSTAPHQHRLAVGIDLGTTNSLVATVRNGMAQTLPDERGAHLLPSIVRFEKGSLSPVVGAVAKQAQTKDPLNTISSVKRLMGRSRQDIVNASSHIRYQFVDDDDNVPRVQTALGAFTPIEISSEILKVLKHRAEASLGGELAGAVITVPAYFDDAQRQATKDAAKLAGINVFRLLNEPTAAALAYGLDQQAEGVHVIYDLGGGTFDVSVLRLRKGVFEVLSTAGNSALGGDDFDRVIVDWMLDNLQLADEPNHQLIRVLNEKACAAKEALSSCEAINIELSHHDTGCVNLELTRGQLNRLIDPLIKQTLLPCRRALRDAGINAEEIQDVVMVGGSTRVPRVRQQVGEFFKTTPLVDIDPDKVVAIGAAIQADVLAGNKPDSEMLLLDVIPLSLGIETMGGLVEKVIERNTTIPVARAQEFTTFKDGQTAMSVHVVQGERDLVSDCRSLAKFELRGIPPMVAGAARIRVTFQVDADGLLSVTAQEQTTGTQSSVEVKPSYGLDDKQIENMIRDSMANVNVDVAARNLREQQVEAQRVIDALAAALQADGDRLLNAREKSSLELGLEKLKSAASGHDHLAIKKAIDALNAESMSFAGKRMNESIQQAMSGHNIDEFN